MSQTLKYHTKVKRGDRVELQKVPMKPGTPVKVMLVEKSGNFEDLLSASASSTDFWNNPIDNETWNDAQAKRYSSHSNSLYGHAGSKTQTGARSNGRPPQQTNR